MGFSEVIQKIPFYFGALKKIEAEVHRRNTKTAIVIDFQDFNLRLAKKLSKKGVKVLYYVAPQAWVWKAYRAEVLSQTVHTLFAILPFEKKWFKDRGVKQVRSIPHPLMLTYQDELSSLPAKPFGSWNKKLKILLLPGSRRFEVHLLFPLFIEAVCRLREFYPVEVHLVKVSHLDQEIYDFYQNEIDVVYPSEQLTNAMRECHVAFAASGTVTLSTGLFELPTIVCYKASLMNEFIFNNFIRYEGLVSLTNIIHGKELFPELIQDRADAATLVRIIRTWIENESVYNELKSQLRKTKTLLSGETFSVSEYMAKVIHE